MLGSILLITAINLPIRLVVLDFPEINFQYHDPPELKFFPSKLPYEDTEELVMATSSGYIWHLQA